MLMVRACMLGWCHVCIDEGRAARSERIVRPFFLDTTRILIINRDDPIDDVQAGKRMGVIGLPSNEAGLYLQLPGHDLVQLNSSCK
jgi:hypothetical protein